MARPRRVAGAHLPSDDALLAVIERSRAFDGALLPILHDIQHTFGWVPASSVPIIAQALNLSRADVHGVLTFYHDFRQAPAGRHVLKLCQAEACQSRGSRELTAHAEARLGVPLGETTADGAVTLEAWILFGIIFLWPPPHFWALSLYNHEDYARANVPMLPVTAGVEATKRQVIANSYFVHSRKGTICAIRRVVEPLVYLIRVLEWWEETASAAPGTFNLDSDVLDSCITAAMSQEL